MVNEDGDTVTDDNVKLGSKISASLDFLTVKTDWKKEYSNPKIGYWLKKPQF